MTTASSVVATRPVRAGVRAATCPADELPQVAHALLADLVTALPVAVSATVVTVTPGPRLRPWATSGPAGLDLDGVQTATGQGPAMLAGEQDELVVSGDVWADARWDLPVRGAPSVRSVIAAVLPGSTRGRAVLTVHGAGPELTDPSVVERIVAEVPDLALAVALVMTRLQVEDLERALVSNRTIGAAIGVTMSSQKLTYDAASELLRATSNNTNTRLADLAEAILFTGELPPPVPPRARGRRPLPPV